MAAMSPKVLWSLWYQNHVCTKTSITFSLYFLSPMWPLRISFAPWQASVLSLGDNSTCLRSLLFVIIYHCHRILNKQVIRGKMGSSSGFQRHTGCHTGEGVTRVHSSGSLHWWLSTPCWNRKQRAELGPGFQPFVGQSLQGLPLVTCF